MFKHTSGPNSLLYKQVVWTFLFLIAVDICLVFFILLTNLEMLYSQANQKRCYCLYTFWLEIYPINLYQHITGTANWSVLSDYWKLDCDVPWGSISPKFLWLGSACNKKNGPNQIQGCGKMRGQKDLRSMKKGVNWNVNHGENWCTMLKNC